MPTANTPSKLPSGKFFHATAEENLQQARKNIVFVPDSLIHQNGDLNLEQYQAQRWQSINSGANPHAIGSHLFPDMNQPTTAPPEIIQNLERLIQKTIGKLSRPKLPGAHGINTQLGL